jgi:hypothetical protein
VKDCTRAIPAVTVLNGGTPVPFYQMDGITIYHDDAREILSSLNCETIITDPVWPIWASPKTRCGSFTCPD